MFLAKSVSIHSVSSMDPTSLLPRERLAVLNFSLGHVGPGLGGERGAHPWKKMDKAIRLERNVLKYFKPLLWPADRDKLTHFQKTTTSSQKSKTCWSSESNHIYIILKASVNIMVAFEEMIWFMEGINVSSAISLNLLWSLRLSLIYHFKKTLNRYHEIMESHFDEWDLNSIAWHLCCCKSTFQLAMFWLKSFP